MQRIFMVEKIKIKSDIITTIGKGKWIVNKNK